MPVELSDSNTALSHVVARDEELVLRLSENPTTGYRWEVTQSGVGELGLVDDQFVAGAGDAVPGAGGHRMVRFVGRKPGNVQLEVVKRRSWEPSAPPLEKRVYSIVVS